MKLNLLILMVLSLNSLIKSNEESGEDGIGTSQGK